ncbi:MAG: hypothetical protein ACTSUE_00470 [Promethearchaeota archaeon]
MAKKRKTVMEGYLIATDVRDADERDETIKAYWNKVKHNLYILGDAVNQKVVFLNRELRKIARKYEGYRIKITFEVVDEPARGDLREGEMPNLDEQYEGFEKFKMVLMNIFNIG